MDQFPLITSLQEHDRKKKAAAAASQKDKKLGEGSGKQQNSIKGQQKPKEKTIMGKMGKAFDRYAENATEHYEDKGMRMKPHWL